MTEPRSLALPVIDDRQQLSAIFERWIGELIPEGVPRETNATCDACPMCDVREVGGAEQPFNPAVKCCSYTPVLPNFLVGQILSATDAEGEAGRESVRRRMRLDLAVTPLGIGRPASTQLMTSDASLFGRSEAQRCPHWVESPAGNCGIWNFRNSICATWFCKHIRGSTGQVFWRELRDLLNLLEHELSLWVALELGGDTSSLLNAVAQRNSGAEARLAAELIPAEAAAIHRRTWGAWHGREEDFYRRSAERVSALSWSEIEKAVGPMARLRAQRLREAYQALRSHNIPARLKAAPVVRRPLSDKLDKATAYSLYDPLTISRDMLSVLYHFDGRPVTEALQAMRAAEQVELDAGLLGALIDFGFLLPVDAPPASSESQAPRA